MKPSKLQHRVSRTRVRATSCWNSGCSTAPLDQESPGSSPGGATGDAIEAWLRSRCSVSALDSDVHGRLGRDKPTAEPTAWSSWPRQRQSAWQTPLPPEQMGARRTALSSGSSRISIMCRMRWRWLALWMGHCSPARGRRQGEWAEVTHGVREPRAARARRGGPKRSGAAARAGASGCDRPPALRARSRPRPPHSRRVQHPHRR
jgi:hypothetical protein